jgi:hypothetical protein
VPSRDAHWCWRWFHKVIGRRIVTDCHGYCKTLDLLWCGMYPRYQGYCRFRVKPCLIFISNLVDFWMWFEVQMSWLFPFLSAWPQSAYAISLTPSVALTFSADAQHGRSALLSELIHPSHQGTTAHVQVMRPSTPPHYSYPPIMPSSLLLRYNLCLSPLALSRSYIRSPFTLVSS